MAAIIQAHNLTKVFGEGDARVVAVDHVDIAIHEGELVMITGDSGCGKTTLISLLGCILTPTEGEIWLDGERVDFQDHDPLLPLPSWLDRHANAIDHAAIRREKVGFVFQAYHLLPELDAATRARLDEQGKIPEFAPYRDRVRAGELAWDSLLTAAGLLSFAQDQRALDERIRSRLSS